MAVTPRLDLKQSQSLLMTQQLRQAISLLQVSNLELESIIAKELESNPLLERETTAWPTATPEDKPLTITTHLLPQLRIRKSSNPTSIATTNLTTTPATGKVMTNFHSRTGRITLPQKSTGTAATTTILNKSWPRKNPFFSFWKNKSAELSPPPATRLSPAVCANNWTAPVTFAETSMRLPNS